MAGSQTSWNYLDRWSIMFRPAKRILRVYYQELSPMSKQLPNAMVLDNNGYLQSINRLLETSNCSCLL